MPVNNPGGSGGGAAGSGQQQQQQQQQGAQRATFRPPWVKQGPQPIPMPSAPWTPNMRRTSNAEAPAPAKEPAPVRKTSKITIIPSHPTNQSAAAPAAAPRENGQNADAGGPRRPMARTDTVEKKAPAQAAAAAQPDNGSRVTEEPRRRPTLTHQKSSSAQRAQEPPAQERRAPEPQQAKAPQAPPPPPAPPAPPAPPPAPPAPPPPAFLADKKPLTGAQAQKLDQLRNRPRKRPDYSCLMKEIEGGARLKRVQCNDRSQPLLPMAKAKDQYIYDSEKSNVHNQLLKQIESGIKLKSVKCNDRSRPVLDGLRKFRRQMTVEEQLQKADAPEVLAEPDDLDDIDRVRDDLQSTKQMLALELRNKEAMERENKRLLARLLNLEAELEAERSRGSGEHNGGVPAGPSPDSDKLVAKLKEENQAQQKETKEMETRYHQAAEELDSTKAQLAEALFQKKQAEKQLKEIEDGLVEGGRALQKQLSKKLISSKSGDIRKQMSQARINELRKQSIPVQEDNEDSESEYTDETITDSEGGEEEEDLSNDPEAQERRVQRELKLLATKLKAFKDKEASARRERTALREQLRLQQKALREERKKYKSLQKEVDKMAKLMREDEEEGDEDEEDEDEDEEDEESEESESEESEEDEGSGDELPADAPVDDKRNNLNTRTRRHEGILGALKKGNYLLKANIDRVKDDLSKHREMSLMLQEDLNSVLAELG